MASAELLERFLIVVVILSSRLYVIEKAGLRSGRHVIHAQAEAQGCPGLPIQAPSVISETFFMPPDLL